MPCNKARLWIAALILILGSLTTEGHTLPISYLYVVPDREYVHVELMLNPFELSFFSELDQNKDGQLSPAELEAKKDELTRRLVDAIQLRVKERAIKAEVSGITPDPDTHHVALRAHYRVDARHVALTVKSCLPQLTSGSHLTQVTYLQNGRRQFAQLDMQSPQVTFEPAEKKRGPGVIHSSIPPASRYVAVPFLFALPGMALFGLAAGSISKRPVGRIQIGS